MLHRSRALKKENEMDKYLQFILDNTKDGKFTFPDGCRTPEQVIEDQDKVIADLQHAIAVRDAAMVKLIKVLQVECPMSDFGYCSKCESDGSAEECAKLLIPRAIQAAEEEEELK